MIIDALTTAVNNRFYPAAIRKMLASIIESEPYNLPVGHYQVQGKQMFFNVVEGETKLLADQKPEFHRQYLDIHLVLEGREVIGAGVLGLPLPLSEPFNEAHDLGFSPAIPGETLIHLQPGELAVIFPGELHRPMSTCTTPAVLRKIVAKIDGALLT
ncbi:YhcH/YjgK/YiaL family protein [Serratia marcescens]|uniref:Toxin-antitoxin biofilm protein TabA n=4 Tax=Enterobacterales TaxID=91347 RepID=A0A379YN15_SERMA|nr:YhcH/YjgK/YiaL family protein [Serratia marcescens]KFD14744.1 putative beta-D-galactosidase [Serratia marcescens subsp. marcescens ATCC 13880]KFL03538.1 hypothetical protein DP21_1499 [Serratia marcescens]MCC3251246.1 YhcH/YjgK/YiaL family protein [Serratia marcescens]PNU43198.1 YhcH/YjgK/YiaL family protein [Serratia marcescens subsp. marcescens ATCC 13880]QDL86893.1 YhcH/YjgK/YiaL family protein [Serratia marcescens subsp. marcescens ATCC 13880]